MKQDILAAVDLGSNSFHLQIGRVVDDQIYLLDSLREPVRLGAGLTRDRRIDRVTKSRAIEALGRFSERLRGLPRTAVRAVGTSALRVAKNADSFLAEAEATLGFPIEVIFGREEARLIYLGVAHSLAPSPERRLVIDVGGGSPLGGGTSAQKRYNIVDSPDLLFADLTDWSVVEPNGFPDYRYNDREVIRAFADNSAPAYDWLASHGVVFVDRAPDTRGGISVGNSAPREMHAAAMTWPQVNTGVPVNTTAQATTSAGVGLVRPLEVTAKKLGVELLLEHRMVGIIRENAGPGRVLGIAVEYKGKRSCRERVCWLNKT